MDWIEVYDMSAQEIVDTVNDLERQLAEARKQAFEEVYQRQKSIYENPEMSSTMVASEMLFVIEDLRREAEK